MADPQSLIANLTNRYVPGKVDSTLSYYFSIEGYKATLHCHPDRCEVVEGPSDGKADVVIKTTKKLFTKVFVKGGMPGPLDIARGKFKTNDVDGLRRLKELFGA